jgi:hypothetical protein
LAHLDALAEAGLTPSDVVTFGEEQEPEPGLYWTLTLLLCCVDDGSAADALEDWILVHDATIAADYAVLCEIADALRIQPNPAVLRRVAAWESGSQPMLTALALESMPATKDDATLLRLAATQSPVLHLSIARTLARLPAPSALVLMHWSEMPTPQLAWEMARAQVLIGNYELLQRLRARDAAALSTLGAHAMDVLALCGSADDAALALEVARAAPGTPHLCRAMGRVGLTSLLPRLLAELESEALVDEAHAALTTMLGSKVAKPSRAAWESAAATVAPGQRYRGGEPYRVEAIVNEMRRADLSAADVQARADEIAVLHRERRDTFLEALGVSLESAISELGRKAH